MRPVLKTHLPDWAFGLPADVLLMHAVGEYCSFCERPLTAESWVWHKREGTDVLVADWEEVMGETLIRCGAQPIERSDWSNVLLLDVNCYLAQRGRKGVTPRGLMPDEEPVCFRLDGDSPITYDLRDVMVVVTDGGDRVIEESIVPLVIADGHDEAASATIAHFQLNSRYFDPDRMEYRISQSDALSAADRRVQQRTEVWKMATRLADIISMAGSRRRGIEHGAHRERPTHHRRGRFLVDLGHRPVEANRRRSYVARRLLLPPGLDWTVGPGPHNPFPGTRRDWLQ